jgi:hypothetical protein
MRTFDQWLRVESIQEDGNLVTGVIPSTYIDMSDFDRIVFLIAVGTMGASSTIDAKVVQGDTAAGGNSKDVPNAAITQLVDADDNVLVSIEVAGSALDVANGFRYVSLSITGAGTAASGYLLAMQYRGGGLGPTQPASYQEQIRVQ